MNTTVNATIDNKRAKRVPPKKPARKLAGERVGIPPRRVHYAFGEQLSKHFFADNRLATQFIAVLSAAFPPGEDFFVDSVKHFRSQVTDKRLRDQVSGFIGQEALHGREHQRLNALLKSKGMNTDVPEKLVAWSLELLKLFPARQQLACTTLMEHFTALLAEELLTDEEFQQAFGEDLLLLWQWHALEELEHKSVAYDVLDLVGNEWKDRRRAYTLVGATVLPAVLLGWTYLAVMDGQLLRPGDTAEGVRVLLGKKGFITRILGKMPLFAKTHFHPAQHDTSKLEARWRRKLFGKNGRMTPMLQSA